MKFQRFTKKNILINLLLITIYLAWCYIFVGIRTDHFVIVAICLTTFYGTQYTRRFVTAFSVFLVYWIIYDSMRVLPNHLFNTVHIEQPYNIEKWLFGFHYHGKLITPNEFFAMSHNGFLDILTGLVYMNWVPFPLAFSFYFFATGKKELFYSFTLVFLLTNILGFICFYLYPAAPPWYYAHYGSQIIIGPLDSRAGFVHFDRIIGIDFFKSIYSKNSNIFAAIPSLHSAYPVILFYYTRKLKKNRLSIALIIYILAVWFSAVYSCHHYIIDVLTGFLLAIIGITLFENIKHQPKIQNLLRRFARNF